MKSLFKAVALITFFSVLTRLAGFLFRIYLSRAIGAEALGIYQVSFSIFMVLVTIVSSGIPLIISRNTAKYTTLQDKQAEKSLIGGSLIFSLVLSLIVCLFVLLFKSLLSHIFTDERCINILIVLLPAVVFSGLYGTFRGWLWGKNNYFGVCISELFEQLVRIIICVIMLGTTFTVFDGATTAAASMSIACALSAILIIIIFFICGGRVGKPKNMYKDVIKPSTPITLVRLATSLVQPVIAILIPLRLVAAGFTNAQAISQYGIAIGMTMPLLFIPSAIIGSLSMALIPDISSAVTKQDTSHIENRITSSLIFSLFVSALFVPLFIGAGQQIGMFFYDNAQSGNLLASAAWIMIPIGLTNVTSSILNALGLEVKSLKNYIIGAIMLLLCVWFLPKYIGVKALIWGMGICTGTASILNIRMIKKKCNTKLKLVKPLFLMCALTIPVAALTSFLANILSNYFTLFFTLAITCSIGAILFILLCMVFNLIDYNAWFVKFKLFKNKKFKLPKFIRFKIKKKTKVDSES